MTTRRRCLRGLLLLLPALIVLRNDYNVQFLVDSVHDNNKSTEYKIPYQGPANGTQWWAPYVDPLVRVFPQRDDDDHKYDWCVPESSSSSESTKKDDEESLLVGLLFVKNYKAASSTGAGITQRMAHSVGAKQLLLLLKEEEEHSATAAAAPAVCSNRASHSFADEGDHTQPRDLHQSLLWTIVRHPASRVRSGFFFFRVGPRQAATEAHLRAYAASEKSAQTKYLDTSMSTSTYHKNAWDDSSLAPNEAAARLQTFVLGAYDFVAVQERMDESLVVMKLLFHLGDWDVIVLSAKRSGSYAPNPVGKCTMVPPSATTTTIHVNTSTYLTTDFERNNYDYLLYAAADKSLDLTMDALGRDRVEHEVEKHQRLQRLAEATCQNEALFPCSQEGKRQKNSKESCYHQDWGCGYRCLDRLQSQYEQGKLEGLY
jgi:hypothetical protein